MNAIAPRAQVCGGMDMGAATIAAVGALQPMWVQGRWHPNWATVTAHDFSWVCIAGSSSFDALPPCSAVM